MPTPMVSTISVAAVSATQGRDTDRARCDGGDRGAASSCERNIASRSPAVHGNRNGGSITLWANSMTPASISTSSPTLRARSQAWTNRSRAGKDSPSPTGRRRTDESSTVARPTPATARRAGSTRASHPRQAHRRRQKRDDPTATRWAGGPSAVSCRAPRPLRRGPRRRGRDTPRTARVAPSRRRPAGRLRR